jgi:hypothetical protein
MAASHNALQSSLRAAGIAVIAAILASAVVGALTLCILWPLYTGSSDNALLTSFNIAFAVFFVGSFAAALGGVIFGLPIFGLLQKTRTRSWPPYTLSGAVAAIVATLAFAACLEIAGAGSAQLWLFTLIWAIPIGSLTGFFAWLIRRPDRDKSAIDAA